MKRKDQLEKLWFESSSKETLTEFMISAHDRYCLSCYKVGKEPLNFTDWVES